MCFHIEVIHIAGTRNRMADYLSRYSFGKEDIKKVEIPCPYASSRSLRTVEAGLETRHP